MNEDQALIVQFWDFKMFSICFIAATPNSIPKNFLLNSSPSISTPISNKNSSFFTSSDWSPDFSIFLKLPYSLFFSPFKLDSIMASCRDSSIPDFGGLSSNSEIWWVKLCNNSLCSFSRWFSSFIYALFCIWRRLSASALFFSFSNLFSLISAK